VDLSLNLTECPENPAFHIIQIIITIRQETIFVNLDVKNRQCGWFVPGSFYDAV